MKQSSFKNGTYHDYIGQFPVMAKMRGQFIMKQCVVEFNQTNQTFAARFSIPPGCNWKVSSSKCLKNFKLNVTIDLVSSGWDEMKCKLKSLNLTPLSPTNPTLLLDIPNVEHLKYKNVPINTLLLCNWTNLEKLELDSIEANTSIVFTEKLKESLKYLSFHDCGLSGIPEIISDLRSLRKLEILGPDTQELHHGINFTLNTELLGKLQNLEELSITSFYQLTIDPSSPFPGLPNLQILKIQNSNLSYLPPGLFHRLKNLTTLNLEHNKISDLSGDLLSQFSNKTKINCRKNLIENLNLTNMDVSKLDLSKNRITNLPSSFGSCKILNLSFNKLDGWNSSQFGGVDFVDLRHNQIRVLNSEMIRDLENVEQVLLGGNPFDCQNCHLYDFQHWLIINKRLKKLDLEDLTCHVLPGQKQQHLLNVKMRRCGFYVHYAMVLSALTIVLLLISSLIIKHRLGNDISYLCDIWKRSKSTETRQEKTFKYDAFVCYSKHDRDWVIELVKQLESNNDRSIYTLCVHERDFEIGVQLLDNFNDCIEQSRRVIIVLSTSFITNVWCKWELTFTQHKLFEGASGNFIVLVELEHLNRDELPVSLRYLMNTRAYMKWPKPVAEKSREKFWKRLRICLGSPIKRQNCTVLMKRHAAV